MKWQNIMNKWGKQGKPFLFIIDFLKQQPQIFDLQQTKSEDILFSINGIKNYVENKVNYTPEIKIKKRNFENYQIKYNKVIEQIKRGNSYLVNLCDKTEIELVGNLEDIFRVSVAPSKLYYKNKFVVFSPESFINILNNKIYTFPMKGTINMKIEDAANKILNNIKEHNEHATIVDLLRNDLGMVANNIKVKRYRYLNEIKKKEGGLLQVVSEIEGDLNDDYKNKLGDILNTLLPAGSITGAPKRSTIAIIKEIEEERKFYTGVFGYFDGNNLYSSIMIRFIEKVNDTYFYRSGGGITAQSNVHQEYEELKEKIYVPIN